MPKYTLSKWFAAGSGRATRAPGSDTILFTWNGRAAGHARYVEHVKRYAFDGAEYPSLPALLRAVAAANTRPAV